MKGAIYFSLQLSQNAYIETVRTRDALGKFLPKAWIAGGKPPKGYMGDARFLQTLDFGPESPGGLHPDFMPA